MILRRFTVITCVLLSAGVILRFIREYQVINRYPITSWTQSLTADCAIVVTGGAGRVREGFDLLSEQKVKKLIISGVHPEVRLRELFNQWTLQPQLTEDNIVLEKRSETTWGNAQQSLPIVEALRCRDILLVSSATHMNRAYRTFRAVFPEGIEIKPWSVVGSSYHKAFFENFFEASKSVFYSLWAY
jgi:uncharacterized SAM-binding protein YcdF (DUF218 family)